MNETKEFCTDFLFSQGSFLIGAGSVINLGGNYFEYNTSNSEEEADSYAIRNDFSMVGQDIKSATKCELSKNKELENA